MKNLSKWLVVIGCALLLLAVVSRLTWIPIIVSGKAIKYISLIVLANTCFLLAVLSKK